MKIIVCKTAAIFLSLSKLSPKEVNNNVMPYIICVVTNSHAYIYSRPNDYVRSLFFAACLVVIQFHQIVWFLTDTWHNYNVIIAPKRRRGLVFT